MPIYEYYCNGCGHEFELIQKITDHPVRKCEKCGKLKAKRKISHSSFVLKGSGWYTTDYGGSGSNGYQKSSNDKNTPEEKLKTDTPAAKREDSKVTSSVANA
jgi:putative FmdB family regulatory protein